MGGGALTAEVAEWVEVTTLPKSHQDYCVFGGFLRLLLTTLSRQGRVDEEVAFTAEVAECAEGTTFPKSRYDECVFSRLFPINPVGEDEQGC